MFCTVDEHVAQLRQAGRRAASAPRWTNTVRASPPPVTVSVRDVAIVEVEHVVRRPQSVASGS